MSYDKPKITIDLQEYQDLKKQVETLKSADSNVILSSVTPLFYFAEKNYMAGGLEAMNNCRTLLNKNGFALSTYTADGKTTLKLTKIEA